MLTATPPPPATLPGDVVDDLRSLARSRDYVAMLLRSEQIADDAAQDPDPAMLAGELKSLADEGSVVALMAIESLGRVPHPLADDVLVDLLTHQDRNVRRHASWRLADRNPTVRAIPTLIDRSSLGGIDTMHAHRTLRNWAKVGPDSIARSIVRLVIDRLVTKTESAERARLIDLLGAIGRHGDDLLLDIAGDRDEHAAVRTAAVGALGERLDPRIDDELNRLAASDEEIGLDVVLAMSGRVDPNGLWTDVRNDRTDRGGLRIAQLVLARGLDGQLSLGGRGDTGGVASLLVSLGEALADRLDVEHVLTIGRGTVTDAVTGPLSSSRIPLSYGTVAFGERSPNGESPNEAWEHLPAIERGIRRVLRLAGPVDVLHLRMADAGTLAGSEVALAAGIPICFSVAPDPHNVVESLQSRGELDDESFARLDSTAHVWFRARLVERLAREAAQLALFPRAEPIAFLGELGAGAGRSDQRAAVVAEGIDIRLLDRAAENSSVSPTALPGGDVLAELAARIPPSRRHLPLLLSVGRLNPVKGMDRIVAAWAGDDRLRERCNLVIVGGDLDCPSATELDVLGEIDRAFTSDEHRSGLVLLGGRPRNDIARLLAATVTGRDLGWAGGGVYVDGALKEEFGLAVLEALAAGLVVVAPSTGGPSTYVEHGDSGILVDPDHDLGRAIDEAFGLVDRYGRAKRARSMVEQNYSIETMAAGLVDLYQPAMAVR